MGWRRGGGQSIDISDPRATRIDDEARLDAALSPALVELDCISIVERPHDLHRTPVQDIGALRSRIEKYSKSEARIVGLAVVVLQNRGEVVLTQPWELGDGIIVEPPASRQPVAEGQDVVDGEPRS